MAFPTTLDDLTTNNDITDGDSYVQATDIDTLNVAVDALQAKVGIDGSAVTTSQDYKPVRKLTPSEANGTHGVILVGSVGESYPNLIGRYLKPLVTEWLMGWPLGWTALEPLEMDKYQKWLDEHGGS